MAPVTPQDWLPILAKRLDARRAQIARQRSYVDGNAPLPEMGPNTRKAWIAFQKKARVNLGLVAVQSFCNRVRAQSVRVGSDDASPATLAARRIWRDNRMAAQVADAVWDREVTGFGYLVTGLDEGRALVTREDPAMFYAEPDAARPWRAKAALKVWRDDIDARDYALVWAGGVRQWFERPSLFNGQTISSNFGDQWQPGASESFTGGLPVKILARRDGQGLIEPHFDALDQINQGKLQRLVTTAQQAYRLRALKGGPLPESDEQGNKIDWGQILEAAPGALWDLPEGIDLWESQYIDIRPMLDGEKEDKRTFAAVTGTPVTVFLPDGANQSAEGAFNAKEQQILAAQDEIERIAPAVAAVMVDALAAEGVDIGAETVEVAFQNPAHVSITEKYAAAAQAKAVGESISSIQRNILGYTPDQIAADELARASESSEMALLAAAIGKQTA